MFHKFNSIVFFLLVFMNQDLIARDYYVHPVFGNDLNSGESMSQSFKTLNSLSKLYLLPGDRILLACGETYIGSINILKQNGILQKPIVITSIPWKDSQMSTSAIIDFKNHANGVLLEDSSFIEISNILLTANGYFEEDSNLKMRCGVLVTTKESIIMEHINIHNIDIQNVYYENPGFIRGKEEVKSANGTQKYGFGIRLINNNPETTLLNITIENCRINSVCHTGIKLTGNNKNIKDIKILNNKIINTGGPGIQMSEVSSIYVANNKVSYSGCDDDSRKWGRGSGLWTWGASNVLIEKNEFLYANGPGDSAGAHIDYNCDNIVLQYNMSAFNAGGFCEILGNNYNCMYRYNISINDGHRLKGVNGAFQEGKVFWLSGYQGNKEPKGPVNSYFYNNTIYSDATIEAKFAIDKTTKGIVIANNIFCIKGTSKAVLGDQNKKDAQNSVSLENVFFMNNLFLNENTWPKDFKIADSAALIGNPLFSNSGGLKASDYVPKALNLVKNKGVQIPRLPDSISKLLFDLKTDTDIMNVPIGEIPSIGAIVPVDN